MSGRRIGLTFGGVGVLSACVLLSACSPVKMGAAAVVGNQRITVASLDSQVGNLKAAAKQYSGKVTVPSTANMPADVLSWLIRFAVMDEVAAANGITVSNAQAQQGLSDLNSVATQNGFSNATELLIANGVPPQLFHAAGRWWAQQTAYELKENGGKLPSSQAQSNKFNAAFSKAQCQAAKSLSIQVSPQFGRMDYSKYSVVPVGDTLSRPEGAPSPSPTSGLVPAC